MSSSIGRLELAFSVAFSCILLSIFGVGLALTPGAYSKTAHKYCGYKILGQAGILGQTFIYLTALMPAGLSQMKPILMVLATFGWLVFAFNSFRIYRQLRPYQRNAFSTFKFILVLFLVMGFTVKILGEPISSWDARSIWFFHGKMLYYANPDSLLNVSWLHPSVAFSHADYPKLVATTSAWAASIIGTWNEYLPKTSILVLTLTATFLLFSLARNFTQLIGWLFLILLNIGNLLWVGLMDGYLAVFASLALWYTWRGLEDNQGDQLLTGGVIALFLCQIKNEGQLFLAIFLVVIFPLSLLQYKKLQQHTSRWALWPLFLTLATTFVWKNFIRANEIKNDLFQDSSAIANKLITRLTDGSLSVISGFVAEKSVFYQTILGSLFILTGLSVYAHKKNRVLLASQKAKIIIAFAALGACYTIGITSIYLLTPHDLVWHLETSLSRTILIPVWVLNTINLIILTEGEYQVIARPNHGI